jgi:hypothetical protein
MEAFMKRCFEVVLGMVLVCLAGRLPAQGLPRAEEVLDKYIEVTGGKEAYGKVKNRVSRGTVELAGVKGTVVIYQAAPNLMLTEMNIEGLGKFLSGSNGEVAWEINPITGPRLKEGKEKATSLRTSQFNSDLDWRKVYKKVEVVGEEKVDSKTAYKVEAATPEGDVITKLFDKATGLAVQAIMTFETPQGKITTSSTVSDYKKADGILQPHRIVTKALGSEIIIVLEKVEQNAVLPKERFALPAEIKKKLEK